MCEIWKPIKGFDGYEISNRGDIRSFRKREKGKRSGYEICKKFVRLMKTRLDAYGYVIVTLSKDKKHHTKKVHRLVLQAFVGDCPKGMESCHNDGKKTNNRAENLRWDTHKNNRKDMIAHGTLPIGMKNGSAKLRNIDIVNIRNLYSQGLYQRIIAKIYSTSQRNISRIVNKKRWKHI